jgi:hypothetical protein
MPELNLGEFLVLGSFVNDLHLDFVNIGLISTLLRLGLPSFNDQVVRILKMKNHRNDPRYQKFLLLIVLLS